MDWNFGIVLGKCNCWTKRSFYVSRFSLDDVQLKCIHVRLHCLLIQVLQLIEMCFFTARQTEVSFVRTPSKPAFSSQNNMTLLQGCIELLSSNWQIRQQHSRPSFSERLAVFSAVHGHGLKAPLPPHLGLMPLCKHSVCMFTKSFSSSAVELRLTETVRIHICIFAALMDLTLCSCTSLYFLPFDDVFAFILVRVSQ